MSKSPSLVAAVAFAAIQIWAGSALAKAADSGDSDACRVVAPRYEPKPARTPPTQDARFLGGAKLHRPIAAPCPPSRRPVVA